MSRRSARFGFVLAVAAGLIGGAWAHPVHTSFAEATYNRETQTLEVALRVFADDLLAALNRGGTTLSFEKTPESELGPRLRRYLQDNFRVLGRDGRELPHRLLGREFDREEGEERLWFYFEVPLPGGVAGLRLQHRLLLAEVPGQRNTVALRDGSRRTTLVFVRDTPERLVEFD